MTATEKRKDEIADLLLRISELEGALHVARDHLGWALKDHPTGWRLSALQTAYDAIRQAMKRETGDA